MARLIIGRRAASKSPPSPDERVLRLEPAEDFSGILERLSGASRVEVHFPRFGDGRGYSIARLLRQRYGYKGELRAVGQFTRDHLLYMERAGFDAFELREGEDAEAALAAFAELSAGYQK
jgi:uncharacterized protein (DUF934 family)